MTGLIIVIAIALAIFLYFFATQRSLVALDEKRKNALAQINVQLKTRWDAVTNLVEMTKQYTIHEHDTLKDVIAERRITMPHLNRWPVRRMRSPRSFPVSMQLPSSTRT